jgi:hypothetical protein
VRGRINPGDVISYYDMCAEEGTSLRRGMNYQLRRKTTVILMSTRPGAPYKDRVEENGHVLIYEGHDNPKPSDGRKPKEVDQEETNPDGSLTQNGLFARAAKEYKQRIREPEIVRVYEKIKTGIWVYNGLFLLTDVWLEPSGARSAYKFRLELAEREKIPTAAKVQIEQTRVIPTAVKLEVWRRDEGKCVKCEAKDNLHFDHIIPYSKGGTSMDASNIQLLCARHNLEKRDRIE